MAISITQTQTQTKVSVKSKQSEKIKNFDFSFPLRKRVKGKELALFTSQMSLMLETGHSLNRALEVLAPQIQNSYLKEVMSKVLIQIESGELFSEALEKYSKVFSSLFISVIKVGEIGGFLKQMMKQLAEYYHQKEEYISAIRKALVYPLVLSVFAFLVVCFVIMFVFPRLAVFLQGKEALLPLTTRFLMGLSKFLQSYRYLLIIGLLIAGISIWSLLKTEAMALWFEKQRFKIPIIKTLLIQSYTSYFLSNLGFLLAGGVPLLDGLMVTKSTVSSSLYQKFIQDLIESVEKGGSFSAPFRKQSFIPITVKEMVQTGEETGNLKEVVTRLGEYYAQEFRKGMEMFCSILEPIIIILMGVVVGVIVLSIIIPIFRLSSGI